MVLKARHKCKNIQWTGYHFKNILMIHFEELLNVPHTKTAAVGSNEQITHSLELSMWVCEISKCPEKALVSAFSLLKAPTWAIRAFTAKNLLRHYAKQAFKQHKFKDSLTALASTRHRTAHRPLVLRWEIIQKVFVISTPESDGDCSNV